MLIEKNYTDKKLTKYKCDICNKEIHLDDIVKIFIQKDNMKNYKKKYDLCRNCYRKLELSIKKYNKKHEE